MENVAALVAQKRNKIQILEDKRIKTEQEKEQRELDLEEIQDRLNINYRELDELIKENQLSRDSQNELGKLLGKNLLGCLIIAILSCGLNPMLAYLLVAYIICYIPKYITLIKNICKGSGGSLMTNISSLRNEISALENNKDRIMAIIRKLDYALADIDTEKKVMQDIIEYMLSRETRESTDESPLKTAELNLTRVNPSI